MPVCVCGVLLSRIMSSSVVYFWQTLHAKYAQNTVHTFRVIYIYGTF